LGLKENWPSQYWQPCVDCELALYAYFFVQQAAFCLELPGSVMNVTGPAGVSFCRWLLSGTPIQNSVQDLFSYFRFLRWAPFDQLSVFKEHIMEPVKASPEKAYQKLQGILQVFLSACIISIAKVGTDRACMLNATPQSQNCK
jgi:hypothetical protein